MQTPKFPVWICALTLCGSVTLRADDTPAQADARAALMQQLQGNSAPSATTSATPAPSSPTITSAPTMVPFTTPTATTSVDPVTGDTPSQATARAALMQQLNQGVPASAPAPATTTMTKTEVTPAPVMIPATPSAAKVSVIPAAGDTPAQAEARAALYQKMAALGLPINQSAAATASVAVKTPKSQPTAATVASVVTKSNTTTLQRIPIVAPALPVSLSQDEKLKALLARYMADQVTPEQYQQQRAAILAAP